MKRSGEWGETLARAESWWRTQMSAARAERQRRTDPVEAARHNREVALAQRQSAINQAAWQQNRYQQRLRRWRFRASTGLYAAAGLGGLALVDTVTVASDGGVIPGAAGMWWIAAAVSGLVGMRARTQLRHAQPPAPAALPVVPPPVLAADAVGAAEAQRLARAEAQLWEMLPVVDQLHHEAADSLRRTLASVQPGMYALIERLDLVSRVDTLTAPQAAEAAEALRRRLVAGLDAYDRLIAATAVLLSAPDPGGAATDQLSRASHELEAYAAGLTAASDAFDSH